MIIQKIAAFWLLFFILLLGGCQKAGSLQKEESPKSKLVPKELAKQVAEKFDPALFSKVTSQLSRAKIVSNTITSDLLYNDKTG